jgi:hypothetical protein
VVIWYILWSSGIFYGHLAYVMAIWSIFPRFGMLYQEKSGNPAHTLMSTASVNEHTSFLIFYALPLNVGQCVLIDAV